MCSAPRWTPAVAAEDRCAGSRQPPNQPLPPGYSPSMASRPSLLPNHHRRWPWVSSRFPSVEPDPTGEWRVWAERARGRGPSHYDSANGDRLPTRPQTRAGARRRTLRAARWLPVASDTPRLARSPAFAAQRNRRSFFLGTGDDAPPPFTRLGGGPVGGAQRSRARVVGPDAATNDESPQRRSARPASPALPGQRRRGPTPRPPSTRRAAPRAPRSPTLR
jgi:hypothetical protein